MEQAFTGDLALEHNRLRISADGEELDVVPVSGERSKYTVTMRLRPDGDTDAEPDAWSGDLWCCRVYSTDDELPFSWAVWSVTRMDRFCIVQDPGLAAYAAWAHLASLCFERIDSSRDLEEGLVEYFSRLREQDGFVAEATDNTHLIKLVEYNMPSDPTGVLRLRLTRKMGSEEFIGIYGHFLDIRPEYIDRDADGRWTVKVTGPNSDHIYTFVSDDGTAWERK
jgi:hypothetical protein